MMKAFRKAGIEVRLLEESLMAMGKGLVTHLETVPEAEAPACYDYSSLDTWFPIEKSVRELFRVDLLKADAVELLLEASGLRDSPHETLVLQSLYAGLPDDGQKAVTVKYPKLADVLNVASLLDCVHADSTQFPGRKTDWARWFKARFKSIDGTAQSSSFSSAVSAGKKTATPQLAKGKHPRKEARQPCSKERCTCGSHTPAKCYVLHPELRPQFKKHKSSFYGQVRAMSAMKKAPAVSLQPVHAKRLAAMTQEIDGIRSRVHLCRKPAARPRITDQLTSLFFEKLGIRHSPTTAYRPQANGRVERMHRTLKMLLAKMTREDRTLQ
ncbi:hypothetical protein BGZ72_007006 [Mortierella alpina]|nr:hypothetical protein BGZ72_007006 [Mortierella alpina]